MSALNKSYRVTWAIDVEAANPREAARRARMYAMRTWHCEVAESVSLRAAVFKPAEEIDLGTIGSPDGETQAEGDQLKVMHYGELFGVQEIFQASPEQARIFGCEPGQPILVVGRPFT